MQLKQGSVAGMPTKMGEGVSMWEQGEVPNNKRLTKVLSVTNTARSGYINKLCTKLQNNHLIEQIMIHNNICYYYNYLKYERALL